MQKIEQGIMGMPIVVEVADVRAGESDLDAVFDYFREVDARFSPFKNDSEVAMVNKNTDAVLSDDMREILQIAEKTKKESRGFFNILRPSGFIDPSGITKGWSIRNATRILEKRGFSDFCITAGGDIQSRGKNSRGEEWSVGIRNPFNREEIVKIIYPRGAGVATSGSYERGAHIYNPHTPKEGLNNVVSVTVIGPDILEADRFATAAFAMGHKGVFFIETLFGFEAYQIDSGGVATMTSDFERYDT